ncbi:retrotransposon protein, putative, ty1-copia subclass [Tanacetum coccineum]
MANDMLKELKNLVAQQQEQELLQTTQRLGHPVTLGLVVSLILIGLRKEFDGFVQNYNMHSGKTGNGVACYAKDHEAISKSAQQQRSCSICYSSHLRIWLGKALSLSYLKVWGCEALVKQDILTKPDKLEPRSIKCIFIGYPKETMRYSFYYPPENKVLVARNAEILENSLITQEASGSLEDLEIIQEEDTHPSIDTSLHHEEDDLEIDEPQSDIIPIRRSTRTRNAPNHMCLYIDAEEHELGDLDNEVWDLVDLPPNSKIVGSKWLFKKKTDMDGAVHTYKACLVAKGYTQTSGIDYEETFSPIADIRAIRILIAITTFYDYEIWQMDVKTAFLNAYLSEEVYMEQPEGFVNPKYPNRVCKLKRSIYGLKQASRQ